MAKFGRDKHVREDTDAQRLHFPTKWEIQWECEGDVKRGGGKFIRSQTTFCNDLEIRTRQPSAAGITCLSQRAIITVHTHPGSLAT